MIPTLQDLYPWLLLLWLVEGILRLGPLDLMFVSLLGGGFTVKGAGLRIASLLPVSSSFLAHRASVGFTRRGVVVPTRPVLTGADGFDRESFAILPYEALGALGSEGATIRWTQEQRTRHPSAAFASLLAERVRSLVPLDPAERAGKIGPLEEEAFDAEAARRLREDLAGPLTRLRIASTSALLLLLVVYPALIHAELATHRSLGLWLLALLCAQLAVLSCGYRLQRDMERRGLKVNTAALFWAALYPPAATHAANVLARDLYQVFDPAAIAVATLPRAEALRWMRAELYGMRHARAASREKAWREMWDRRRRRLIALVVRHGWSEDALLAAPERSDPDAARYCPLCDMQYVERAQVCSDCRLELVELPEPKACWR